MNDVVTLVLCGCQETFRSKVDEIAVRLNTEEIFQLADLEKEAGSPSSRTMEHFGDWQELAAAVRSPWICFYDGVSPLSESEFNWSAVDVETVDARGIDIILNFGTSGKADSISYVPVSQLEHVPTSVGGWLMRTKAFLQLVDRLGIQQQRLLTPHALLRTWLLLYDAKPVAIRGESHWNLSKEPYFEHWRNLDTYGRLLTENCLVPLQRAVQVSDAVPRWLQRAVVDQLQWYFDVDLRERAPTVVINRSRAQAFHELVGQILALVDEATILELQTLSVRRDVIHALLSYIVQPMYDTVFIDAYDEAQQLARLRYFLHGDWRSETFKINGCVVTPTYAKYRACKFFTRTLHWQRIVWVSMVPGNQLTCIIDGVSVPITMDCGEGGEAAGPAVDGSVLQIEKLHRPAKGGQQSLPLNLRGIKARGLRAIAHLPWVATRFQDAWVFIDRDEDADDSAEHMYRWVAKNHPEINSWFLLKPSTPDWERLEKEGFRLVAPGLQRKLLLLNTRYIISSHAQYMNGGFDPELYGDIMNWRYVFLQHGVIKDDLSHWLGELGFDIFVTSSPAEHESVVGNDTAYQYTDREVYRTGLPRHDRLLRMVAEVDRKDVDVILVMPTWRGGLVDRRAGKYTDLQQSFAESDYVRVWGSFLRNSDVHALCAHHGKRIIFMPHANVAPYVAAFDLPESVEIATSSTTSIQKLFSKSAALITDYTSVAFTFALLRRTVFYYQYDRDDFFGGGHNWREGYFDFERDGFGPVVYDEKALIIALRWFLENDSRPDHDYLERMVNAMPETDGKSCERLFEVIVDIDSPKRSSKFEIEAP